MSGMQKYQVPQKLKKLKLDLKSWSKRTLGNFKNKFERNGENYYK